MKDLSLGSKSGSGELSGLEESLTRVVSTDNFKRAKEVVAKGERDFQEAKREVGSEIGRFFCRLKYISGFGFSPEQLEAMNSGRAYCVETVKKIMTGIYGVMEIGEKNYKTDGEQTEDVKIGGGSFLRFYLGSGCSVCIENPSKCFGRVLIDDYCVNDGILLLAALYQVRDILEDAFDGKDGRDFSVSKDKLTNVSPDKGLSPAQLATSVGLQILGVIFGRMNNKGR